MEVEEDSNLFVIDYYLNSEKPDEIFHENFDFGGADSEQEMETEDTSGLVEFEDIKKYILFGKLKKLKLQLTLLDLERTSPEVMNMFDFLNLIIVFYNTFTYEQAKQHVDVITTTVGELLNIKLPEFDDTAQAKLDPNKVQQAQAYDQVQDGPETADEIKLLQQNKKDMVLARRDANLARKGAAMAGSSGRNFAPQDNLNFAMQGA